MNEVDRKKLFHFLFLVSIFFSSFVGVFTSFKYIALYDLSFLLNVSIFINEGLIPYKDFFLPYPELTFRIISVLISIFGKNLNIIYIWIFVSNLIFSKLIYDLSDHISKKKNTRYIITIASLLVGPYSGISQFTYDADSFLYSLVTLRLISSKQFTNHKYFQFFVGFVASFNILFKQNIGVFVILTIYLVLFLYFRKSFKYFFIGNIFSGLSIIFYYLIQDTLIELFSQALIYPSKTRINELIPFGLTDNNLVDFAIFSICWFVILEYLVHTKIKYINIYIFGLSIAYIYLVSKHINHSAINAILNLHSGATVILVVASFLIFLGLVKLLEKQNFSIYINSVTLSVLYLGFYFLTNLNFRSIYTNDLFEHLRNLRYFLFYFIIFNLFFKVLVVKNNVYLKVISLFFISILISSQYSQGVNSFYALSSMFVISIFIFLNNSNTRFQKNFFVFFVFILLFAFSFFGVNYVYFDTPNITFASYETRFLYNDDYFIQDLNSIGVLQKYDKNNLVFYPNSGLVNVFAENLYFNYFFQHDKTQNPFLYEDNNLWSRYFNCYDVEFVAISNKQQMFWKESLQGSLLDETQMIQVLGDGFVLHEIIDNYYIFKNINNLNNLEINCVLTSLEY